MPKAKLIRSDVFPYHVVTRTTGKFFFELPLSEVYSLMESWINLTHFNYGLQTHHFKLMSNHIHWIFSTPLKNIDLCTKYSLSNIAKEINERTGHVGHLWREGYRYNLIETPEAYLTIMKYNYRNAVKAGIVERVEHYPYSSLQFYYGNYPCRIMLSPDPFDLNISYDFEFLKWLNTPFAKEEQNQIAKSLERQRFKFRRTTRNQQFQVALPDGWGEGVPKSAS